MAQKSSDIIYGWALSRIGLFHHHLDRFFSTVFPGVIYCLGRSANWAEIGSSRWYRATSPSPRQSKNGGTRGTVPAQYAAGASQAAI
jgi:hypothetical protein